MGLRSLGRVLPDPRFRDSDDGWSRSGPGAGRKRPSRLRSSEEASVGADLAVSAAQNVDRFWSHWCPEEADYGLVGDRAAALRTIRADPALLPEGLPGPERVNVVFVDTGLPPNLLPATGFRGWPVLEDPMHPTGPVRHPGNPLTPHGEMVGSQRTYSRPCPPSRQPDPAAAGLPGDPRRHHRPPGLSSAPSPPPCTWWRPLSY